MTKFKITREKVEGRRDYLNILDVDSLFYIEFKTKDLPDLIKALQDKEKEINK